jgi:hypothetical protein
MVFSKKADQIEALAGGSNFVIAIPGATPTPYVARRV